MADARANILITAEDRTKAAFDSVAKSFGTLKTIGGSVLAGFGASEALKAIVESGKEAEQSANRLTAAFRLQGTQVGLTRAQLDDLADSMAAATQFNDNDFKKGEAELLKFGNIYGDVFKRATQLSADLAAFNGGDLVSAFDAVGRALANPIDGMKGLGSAIGKLSAADREHIKTLVEHNQGLEAQTFVLDLLQKKIGGTADLMNSGYTKAIEDTAKAWDKFKEALAGIAIIKDTVVSALEAIAGALRGVASVFQGGSFSEGMLGKQAAMAKQITDLQDQIAVGEQGKGLTFTDDEGRVIGESQSIVDLKENLKALEAEYKRLYQTQAEAPPKVGKVDLGMTQEQIAFLKSLQEENATAQGGGDAVFGKLFKAEQLGVLDKARPLILSTNTAILEQANAVDKAHKAWRDYQAGTQFLEDAADATHLLTADTVLARVGGITNTPGELAKYKEVARQELDAQRLARNFSDENRIQFIKAAEAQQLAWEKAYEENYQVIRSFAYGFKTTMGEIYEDATNSAAQVHDLFVNAFHGMEDALLAFVKTGKFNFHDLADSIISDLIRISIQRNITAPIAAALGGSASSGLLGQVFAAFAGGAAAAAAPGTGATAYGPTSSSFRIELPTRAGGGDISAGMPYWVGENGPELVVPRSNGTVIQNGRAGGIQLVTNIHVDSRADQAQVEQMVRRAVQQGNADQIEQLSRAGAI